MKAPAYPRTKPSGVGWLGDVPEHWQVRRLKFSVSKVGSGVTPKGGAESYERDGVPLLRSQNVHFDGLRMDDVVFISEETHREMSNSHVAGGDVLLNITGASIGRSCSIPEGFPDANVNQHVCIIRPEDALLTEYLHFALCSRAGQAQIDLDQTGSGREGLTFAAIKDFVFPLPGPDEQQQIAALLDWKTAQIDTLIARKQELLEKLKEKRLAVITQAVTRGLNPAAPLRDSGIPWLGQVPEHWEIIPLGFLMTMSGGLTPSMANSEYWEGDIPWVTPKDMKQPRISDVSVR
jgi:type I restriction enzyme S subunit